METQSLEKAEEGLKNAKELCIEIIEKSKEFREKELLDYHQVELIEEGDKLAKKKKKIIAGIKKKLRRDHAFHYLSRYEGKGARDSIKRSQVTSNQNESIESLIKRNEIEERIKDHDFSHLKRAHNSIAFKDRMRKKLKRNAIREFHH